MDITLLSTEESSPISVKENEEQYKLCECRDANVCCEFSRETGVIPKSFAVLRHVLLYSVFQLLKYILLQRPKEIYAAFYSMKNYLDSIYDVIVVYEGKVKRQKI